MQHGRTEQLVERVAEGLEKDLGLVAEVPVERTLREACGRGDVADPRLGRAELAEALGGRVEQRLPRAPAASVAALRCVRRGLGDHVHANTA